MTQYLWQRPEWTRFQWKNESILLTMGECRLLQGKLLGRVADPGLPLENHAQMEILTEETLKTAAIEGESLDVKAIRSSVARKLGLPSAGLPGNGPANEARHP
ncbi:MAG TPA: DUF4172 domain-containing protein [Syntrophales bacterium]|nr:DUF4172 domain-containing protein [Syntrophales bacterium]